MASLTETPQPQKILLSGGDLVDVDTGSIVQGNVLIEGGEVSKEPHSEAPAHVVDVSGLLVTPGLVDLHTHVFKGQAMSLNPTEVGPPSGTTTMVDAGSSGASLFDAFRSAVAAGVVTPRVLAFLNISAIGTTAHTMQGELRGLGYCNEDLATAVAVENRDLVVGVKVRASADVGGSDAVEALSRARRVADRVGLPLMCHLGPAPATSDEILRMLRRGDILTHAFTGFSDNNVTRDSTSIKRLVEARDRGVVIDIGHGQSGFSLDVASRALEAGVFPTTISTDLHRGSRESVVGMPNVMSKFLALGMSITDVVLASTRAPATVIGAESEGFGTLTPGGPADVSVFRVVEGEVIYIDPFGGSIAAEQSLQCVLTIQAGSIVFHDGTLALPQA